MAWKGGAIISKPILRSSITENTLGSLSNSFFQGRDWVSMKMPEIPVNPVS
jgi:hypothetical protein